MDSVSNWGSGTIIYLFVCLFVLEALDKYTPAGTHSGKITNICNSPPLVVDCSVRNDFWTRNQSNQLQLFEIDQCLYLTSNLVLTWFFSLIYKITNKTLINISWCYGYSSVGFYLVIYNAFKIYDWHSDMITELKFSGLDTLYATEMINLIEV